MPSWCEHLDQLIFELFGDYSLNFGTFNLRQVAIYVLHYLILDIQFYSFTPIRVVGSALAYAIQVYFETALTNQNRKKKPSNLGARMSMMLKFRPLKTKKSSSDLQDSMTGLMKQISEHIGYPGGFLVKDIRNIKEYLEKVRLEKSKEDNCTQNLDKLFE